MKLLVLIFCIVLTFFSVNGQDNDGKVNSIKDSETIGKKRFLNNLIPNVDSSTTSPNVNPGATAPDFGNLPLIGTLGTLATILPLAPKGALISLFTGLKFFLISLIITILMIAFLATGTAYFTCSIVDCSSVRNMLGSGGDLGSSLFSRNTYEYEQAQQPIYQAIDNGHAKYGSPSPSYPHQTSFSGSQHYKPS